MRSYIQGEFLVIFTALRVLRITRLIRVFKFTKVIIKTFSNCFENFINIRTLNLFSAFTFHLYLYLYFTWHEYFGG